MANEARIQDPLDLGALVPPSLGCSPDDNTLAWRLRHLAPLPEFVI
jgi:hypothetical protein